MLLTPGTRQGKLQEAQPVKCMPGDTILLSLCVVAETNLDFVQEGFWGD